MMDNLLLLLLLLDFFYKSFLLVKAENAALDQRIPLAKKHYEVAMLLAGRRGFTNDLALIHQRLGEFHLQLGENEDALYHVNAALRLYSDWGALAKVGQVERKHSDLLSMPSEVLVKTRLTSF